LVKTGYKFIDISFAGMASLNFAMLTQEMPSLFWIKSFYAFWISTIGFTF